MPESIDQKHLEFMKKYNNNNRKIKKLNERNKILKYNIYKNKNTNNDKKMNYIDEYKLNKLCIKNLKADEKQYYIKNSKEIFEYFENKKNIQNNLNKKILVNNFFEKKKVSINRYINRYLQ